MQPIPYDVIVIGSGPAGENGAATAATFGKRVAMVEKAAVVGGASVNTGTVPSKTLRETALAISGLKARDLYGVDLSIRREATIADFMFHEKRVKADERLRVARTLARHNVTLYQGMASFLDPHTVRVVSTLNPENPTATGTSTEAKSAEAPNEVVLQAETILIATGSSPVRPALFPFEHCRVHDSDEILEIDRLPKTLAVIGAGVVGSEYACTFAALGVKVWIIDGRDELLPMLDAEVSKALEAAMRETLGITFLWDCKVTACDAPPEGEVTLTINDDPKQKLGVEGVLVAAGRSSNTQTLNLEAAGLTPGNRGLLVVDEHYRTSVPHIYAAGDVIGYPALASTSMEQARVAMCHACRIGLKTEVSALLPTGIYTIPEASMVGVTEEDLKKQGVPYVVGRATYAQSSRGEIVGDNTGFLKLLFRRKDMKLIGVHVMGEHASELVHIGVIAMQTDSGIELFNRVCFNFPTLGDMYKSAAYNALLNLKGEAEAAASTNPEKM